MAILEMQVDASKTLGELREVGDRLPQACDVALEKVGRHVQNIAVRQANRIKTSNGAIPTVAQVNAYNRKGGGRRPKRIGGSGKKAWERTGRLANAIEKGLSQQPGQVTISADVPYAKARHGLGVEWTPKRPALGITRKNPFFAEAIAITEPQVGPIFTNALKNELKL